MDCASQAYWSRSSPLAAERQGGRRPWCMCPRGSHATWESGWALVEAACHVCSFEEEAAGAEVLEASGATCLHRARSHKARLGCRRERRKTGHGRGGPTVCPVSTPRALMTPRGQAMKRRRRRTAPRRTQECLRGDAATASAGSASLRIVASKRSRRGKRGFTPPCAR